MFQINFVEENRNKHFVFKRYFLKIVPFIR